MIKITEFNTQGIEEAFRELKEWRLFIKYDTSSPQTVKDLMDSLLKWGETHQNKLIASLEKSGMVTYNEPEEIIFHDGIKLTSDQCDLLTTLRNIIKFMDGVADDLRKHNTEEAKFHQREIERQVRDAEEEEEHDKTTIYD